MSVPTRAADEAPAVDPCAEGQILEHKLGPGRRLRLCGKVDEKRHGGEFLVSDFTVVVEGLRPAPEVVMEGGLLESFVAWDQAGKGIRFERSLFLERDPGDPESKDRSFPFVGFLVTCGKERCGKTDEKCILSEVPPPRASGLEAVFAAVKPGSRPRFDKESPASLLLRGAVTGDARAAALLDGFFESFEADGHVAETVRQAQGELRQARKAGCPTVAPAGAPSPPAGN